MKALRAHAEGREVPYPLVLLEGRCKKLDQRGTISLFPAPDLVVPERRNGGELEFRENLRKGFFDRVAQDQGEPLEARDVDIVGDSRAAEPDPDPKLALVKAEGLRTDQGSAQPEYAYTCHSRNHLPRLGIGHTSGILRPEVRASVEIAPARWPSVLKPALSVSRGVCGVLRYPPRYSDRRPRSRYDIGHTNISSFRPS